MLFYKEKNLSIDEGSIFVMTKLERSYNKMSVKGKEIIKTKYISSKDIILFD